MKSMGSEHILFFSRGLGRGHAVQDDAIIRALGDSLGHLVLKFVSYGTGADTLAQLKHAPINLQLPDSSPFLEVLVRAGRVIAQTQPRLVISHEEFAVVPAAHMFQIPVLFIAEWFTDSEDLNMEALLYADEIIFLGEPHWFDVPDLLKDKVHYAGVVTRTFSYGKADRTRAREELELPRDCTLVLVLPGSWDETRAPISHLVLPAFDALQVPNKLLIWIAGADHTALSQTASRRDVLIKKHDWQMDRLMVASDLAITKGTRETTKELAVLGVPSISLSYGLNPIDIVFLRRIYTNTALDPTATSPSTLARCMSTILSQRTHLWTRDVSTLPFRIGGAAETAKRLVVHLERLEDGC